MKITIVYSLREIGANDLRSMTEAMAATAPTPQRSGAAWGVAGIHMGKLLQ